MLTTDTTPQNPNRCTVAPPRGATAQRTASDIATGRATATQRISLKALADKHLRRNEPRNNPATASQKTAQQSAPESGQIVACVAGKKAAFDGSVFTLLAAVASRVCREVHGDSDDQVKQMVDDLRHYKPDTWAWLIDHFQGQLQLQPKPQRKATSVRCADCRLATITNGIARCQAGVESGLPIQGFWATDRHLCASYRAIGKEGT